MQISTITSVLELALKHDMRSASKLSFEVIREIIDTLKDNQILDMDAKRFIVSFDSERADALLFPKD